MKQFWKISSTYPQIEIETKLLDPRVTEPVYASDGANACDLVACLDQPEKIYPGETKKIRTGLAIHIKDFRYGGFILPRSGLSTKHGIKLANTIGLIDSDYQGEIIVALVNEGSDPFPIAPLDRIAQLVIMPTLRARFNVVNDFSAVTERGDGGFGSTGK